MGWKEARSRYTSLSSLSEQKVEDLVARRVLRGLGLTEKQIWDAERAVFGLTYDDKALWLRTLGLLKAVWGSSKTGVPLNVQVLWTKPDHKDIITRMREIEEQELPPVIFMTRIKGSDVSLTYMCMQASTVIERLEPPYNVKAKVRIPGSTDCGLLLYQETEHFIAQFGPYPWLSKQMENSRG